MKYITTFDHAFYALTIMTIMAFTGFCIAAAVAKYRGKLEELHAWALKRNLTITVSWLAVITILFISSPAGVTTFFAVATLVSVPSTIIRFILLRRVTSA